MSGRRLDTLAAGAVAVALLGWWAASPAGAAPSAPTGDGPWVVRGWFEDRSQVDALAAELGIWEVHHAEGYLLVDVDRHELRLMEELGFVVEVDAERTALLQNPPPRPLDQPFGIPGYPCYRTVEETKATGAALAASHPQLASWYSIGESWEKQTPGGLPGYDLMVLRLTNALIPGPKPRLFAMGAMHAREYTTAELLTRFAEALVAGYGTVPDATWILDHHEIHLLLQANPDGRKRAEAGASWRKNTNNDYCSGTSLRGADLNRNYSYGWNCCGGSSGNPCAVTYRGVAPASEPETQAVQQYLAAIFPSARGGVAGAMPVDTEGVFLDIHSYSELVLWPWGYTPSPPPNAAELRTLGRKLAWFNDYAPMQAPQLYLTDGTTMDFAYGELGIAAFAFELGQAFFESCSSFENTILPDNLEALFFAAKAARRPYLEPAGPDAVDMVVTPAVAAPGEILTLSAVLDGTRFNQSNGFEPVWAVTGGRFTVDTPPWLDPIGTPVDPVDGAFDSPVEAVVGSLSTQGLGPGRHLVYLVGENVTGRAGVPGAAHFWISGPETDSSIVGVVTDAGTGAPLLATVTAGPYVTVTDPGDGSYGLEVPAGTYTVTAAANQHWPRSVSGVTAAAGGESQVDFTLLDLTGYGEVFTDGFESGDLSAWGT